MFEAKSKRSRVTCDLSCRLTALLPRASKGDPTLAIRYVTSNLATQITFEYELITTSHLCLLRITACCLANVKEVDISYTSRLRAHGFARLVVKNEAVVWWLCAHARMIRSFSRATLHIVSGTSFFTGQRGRRHKMPRQVS
jgi:hypothetical protein